MAGSQTIGQLRAILVSETGQFVADLGKARQVVRDTGKEVETSTGIFANMTRKIDAVGPAMKGAQQATAAAANALRIAGAEGSAAMTGLSNAVSGLLAGGFTPLGLGIAAASAALGLFIGQRDEVEETADGVLKATRGLKLLRTELADFYAGTREARLQRFRDDIEDAEIEVKKLGGSIGQFGALFSGALDDNGMIQLSDQQAAAAKKLQIAREALAVATEKARREEGYLSAEEQKRLDRLNANIASSKAAAKARTDAAAAEVTEAKRVADAQKVYDDWRREMVAGFVADAKGAAEATKAVGDETDKFFDATAPSARKFAEAVKAANDELERLDFARMAAFNAKSKGMQEFEDAAAAFRDAQPEWLTDLAQAGSGELAGGLSGTLEDIARNSRDAGAAMRQFGADFAWSMARVAMNQALLTAVNAAFGAVGIATAPAATGSAPKAGAHGGTFRVGGFGGLDSQLVAMKLSPGELVKVTNGANSGGENGPMAITLVNRPAPVFADEVAARMSGAAKSGLVAAALTRPGRRGFRAGE
jgi:hypothetical protein